MQQNQYLPVHWIDGMKINKNHFIAQNNAFTYQVTQGVSGLLNAHNYGLLPNTSTGNNDLKLAVTTDNQQQVQVRLQQCRAITLGGHVIQVGDGSPTNGVYVSAAIPNLSIPFSELKGNSSDYLVVLIVNPYDRTPYGDADPAELPPRLPYTLPSYKLDLMPIKEVSSDAIGYFQLPVGKLKVLEQKVVLDEDYIAPCSSVKSHSDLIEAHAAIEHFFGKMELYALQIIQKILQKKQQNEMAGIVQKLCENVSFFTASRLSDIKLTYLQQPPVFLISTVSAFARLFKNTLDYYTGSGKEELLNYCVEWCDVKQGELEGAITTLANHPYNHLDINESLEKANGFIKLINHLFANLARLEYIGKRKDTGIFVKEQVIQKDYGMFVQEPKAVSDSEVAPKKRRSFLVD